MKKSITDKAVKALRPKEKPYEVRDTDLQGFLLRIQPSGAMTFYFEYKNPAGKKNRHRLGSYPTMTVRQAHKKAREKSNEVFEGGDPQAEKKQASRDLTLEKFLDDVYKPWAETNLKSHAPTMIRLKANFKPLLKKKLVDLSPFDFEKHRITRLKSKSSVTKRPPSAAAINRDQQTLRAALSRAVEWKHMDTNPLTGTKKAKEDKNRSIRAMTATEEADALDAFRARRDAVVKKWQADARKGKQVGPPVPTYLNYFEPAVIVSLDCGLRRGELIALLWADVDLALRTITVRGEGAKSSQTRTVPLSERVRYTLAKWSGQSGGEGRVFPGATVDSIRAKWRILCRDAKVKGLRWHDLRHTFGSRLAMAGVTLPVVQRLMGHASITTTARYLHATDEDARKAVDVAEATRKGNIVQLEMKRAEN